MIKKIEPLWKNPVKRRWFIIFNLAIFGALYLSFKLLDDYLSPIGSLSILLLALIFEIIGVSVLMSQSFVEIWRDILSFIKWSNRDATYQYYQFKNKDKEYKGPDWEDEIFSKIGGLKQRVDAFVKASIDYQEVDFERWKKRNVGVNLDGRDQTIVRSFQIILAAIISLCLLIALLYCLGLNVNKIRELIENSKGTVLLGVLTTFIGSPIIFMVWLFRDKNNRVQIENARKDTNLKDFQKLSEWASGFHLPEVKQTISTKTTDKKVKDAKLENTSEILISKEDFLPPDSSNSISRRQGAEALQASAIAQLEAFMFGKYGEQFMQPAFLLIHAIWESIITQHQMKIDESDEFKDTIEDLIQSPIVSALNKALVGANGAHLLLFKNNLPGLNLIGLTAGTSSLKSLTLTGNNLKGINLSYSSLWECHLLSVNLYGAKLIEANFTGASLLQANLTSIRGQSCDFSYANLQYANLSRAKLENAHFINANMRGCQLFAAKLQDTHFLQAKLQGADLRLANLINADLEDMEIDHTTQFGSSLNNSEKDVNAIRENILSRGAIWDDDPEWLVGKIQSAELLEKIRQDHLART